MGVVFNNTVVPAMGWNAMFILLGCFTLVSFIMLLFFRPVRGKLIPFDDEDDDSYDRVVDDQDSMQRGIDYFDVGKISKPKKKRKEKKALSSSGES